jgi:hypothetical protein
VATRVRIPLGMPVGQRAVACRVALDGMCWRQMRAWQRRLWLIFRTRITQNQERAAGPEHDVPVLPASCGGLWVDGVFGQLRQELVRALLLGQGLLEKILDVGEAELIGPGEKRAVASDLVVLDRLRRGN